MSLRMSGGKSEDVWGQVFEECLGASLCGMSAGKSLRMSGGKSLRMSGGKFLRKSGGNS